MQKKILVITGAGLSASTIGNTYRKGESREQGFYKTNESLITLMSTTQFYDINQDQITFEITSLKKYQEFYNSPLTQTLLNPELNPTQAHNKIAQLQHEATRKGSRLSYVTLNIDSLEDKLERNIKNPVFLHGKLNAELTRKIITYDDDDSLEITTTTEGLCDSCKTQALHITEATPKSIQQCSTERCEAIWHPGITLYNETPDKTETNTTINHINNADIIYLVGLSFSSSDLEHLITSTIKTKTKETIFVLVNPDKQNMETFIENVQLRSLNFPVDVTIHHAQKNADDFFNDDLTLELFQTPENNSFINQTLQFHQPSEKKEPPKRRKQGSISTRLPIANQQQQPSKHCQPPSLKRKPETISTPPLKKKQKEKRSNEQPAFRQFPIHPFPFQQLQPSEKKEPPKQKEKRSNEQPAFRQCPINPFSFYYQQQYPPVTSLSCYQKCPVDFRYQEYLQYINAGIAWLNAKKRAKNTLPSPPKKGVL